VKICGLTVPEEARGCAELGADAIGLVFYPPSPRYLTISQAAAVTRVLPPHVSVVGVFVDPTMEMLADAIEACGLCAVQLHGNEPPELPLRITDAFQIPVIKVLFASREPGLACADHYKAAAFLVECGKGRHPGGNAEIWDWASARDFVHAHATVLAGGLDPHNVIEAIGACLPDAIDISSGLESSPGRKDLDKVERLLAHVRKSAALYASAGKMPRIVF
jgi:phosphoribosylanthranilate isomerase